MDKRERGGRTMKFLIKGSYQASGVKGLLSEGGTSRREAIRELTESLGASLEAFYFAFGDTDVYAIVDAPDVATITALALHINATGAVSVTTVPLITAEEVDEATKKKAGYRAPGV